MRKDTFKLGGDLTSSFLYDHGVVTPIVIPGNSDSVGATGINNNGQIVGWYGPGNSLGFLYSGGSFTTISIPGVLDTTPFGLNDAGSVVGFYDLGGLGNRHGFLYSEGRFTTIDSPGFLAMVSGINDAGDVVGTFYHKPNAGQLNCHLGAMFLCSSGFLYHNGVLSVIDAPGSDTTYVMGINKNGEIVGEFEGSRGLYGFTFDQGAFTTIDATGSEIGSTNIVGINDLGQVLGYTTLTGTFLATPVSTVIPEPGSSFLLATGLIGMFALWRVREP